MKKIFYSLSLLLLPAIAWAQNPSLQDQYNQNLDQAGNNLGYNTANTGDVFINSTIGQVITIALGFVGVIFFVMIFMSGFQWLMSGGNPETIKKAKARLINSVIGLAIVLAAYLITTFVYNQIVLVTH